mgnify:CR=1 FL=1
MEEGTERTNVRAIAVILVVIFLGGLFAGYYFWGYRKQQHPDYKEMLRQTISVCPDSLWTSPDDKGASRRMGYHVLFYTQLFLSDSAQSLRELGDRMLREANDRGGKDNISLVLVRFHDEGSRG